MAGISNTEHVHEMGIPDRVSFALKAIQASTLLNLLGASLVHIQSFLLAAYSTLMSDQVTMASQATTDPKCGS